MLNRTSTKAENLLDRFSATPYSSAPLPPKRSGSKQYGEVSEWLKEHAWKVCIRQRIGGSNPPLTAIFEKELVRKYGLFFRMLHACGGDENTRPGFDNWRQPVGQTESVANRLPEGRAKRVNPPLTAIFEKELVRKYGLFFRMLHACGGDENTRPGFDNWRQPVGQTESVANRLPAQKRRERF